jgi:uncharacterized protein YqgV (UPF0045/DUF77 family)
MGLRVEFTVEPFVEGSPGPHVSAALDAVRAAGLEVSFGPFGTMFEADTAVATSALAALVEAATEAGASRISVQVSTA